MKIRIDKYLSHTMGAARSEVKKLIKSGAVTINGVTVTRPEQKADENSDTVTVNGQAVTYREYVYLMLNKPQGYVSATEDKHYKTVTELVPAKYAHYGVFPVGRLDIDTEGLLLLTNDGTFAHRLTSPAKNVYKKYFAVLSEAAEKNDIDAFAAGMEFKDFTAKPAAMEICDNPREVYISIAEGKFHQIKRMCERVGKTVEYLKRVSIGGLELDSGLEKGEIRELTEEELSLFKT